MFGWLLMDADAAANAALQAGHHGTLVLDLTTGAAPLARRRIEVAEAVLACRAASAQARLYVLVEPTEHGTLEADLAAIVPAAPDGIVLGGCASARDVQHLGSKLAVAEAEAGLNDGATRIVALLGTRPDALFAMQGFAGASRRLAGLALDGARLAATLGLDAGAKPMPAPLALARGLVVAAAHSAGVPAIDAGFGLTGEALAQACRLARQDGFSAMMTRDSVQAGAIETAFSQASGVPSGR